MARERKRRGGDLASGVEKGKVILFVLKEEGAICMGEVAGYVCFWVRLGKERLQENDFLSRDVIAEYGQSDQLRVHLHPLVHKHHLSLLVVEQRAEERQRGRRQRRRRGQRERAIASRGGDDSGGGDGNGRRRERSTGGRASGSGGRGRGREGEGGV